MLTMHHAKLKPESLDSLSNHRSKFRTMKKHRGMIALIITIGFMTGCAQILQEQTSAELNKKAVSNIKEDLAGLYPPQWRIECNVDQFTDEKACEMSRFFVKFEGVNYNHKNNPYQSVSVKLNRKSELKLRFGFQDNPYLGGQIRLGKNGAEEFKEFVITGDQAEKILSQMQSEKSGIIETHKWPNQRIFFEIDLQGFNDSYAELKKAIYN